MTFLGKYIFFLVMFVILFGGTSYLMANDVAVDVKSLENAFASGQISRTDKLMGQAEAVFGLPGKNAESIAADDIIPIKSATDIIMEIDEYWDDFSKDQQTILSNYMSRPAMDSTYDSPLGYFKIHYNLTGYEPISSEDLDGNSIPDYAERIAWYVDSAWMTIVNNMGYLPPPTDDGRGGDNKYDVYLISVGAYGVTYPDEAGDSAWYDYSSFIGIHNTMAFAASYPNNDPEGVIIGAMKVTCAHEFFHAIQLGYNYDYDYLWWMEVNSVWMENIVFPVVDDNYNYLPSFFDSPHTRLIYDGDYHKYGAFVWASYLQKEFDITVMRSAWEESRWVIPSEEITALQSIDSALSTYGTKVKNTFREFTEWNYFTGSRAMPDYYDDAADYPEIYLDQEHDSIYNGTFHPVNAPGGLSCNYITFNVNTAYHGHLEIQLDGPTTVEWTMTVIAEDSGADTIVIGYTPLGGTLMYAYIPHAQDFEKITVIPAIKSQYQMAVDYEVSLRQMDYGDMNNDGSMNIADASYLVNFIFFDGEAPKPFYETGDANCDGTVNIADASIIINYIFFDGIELCGNR